MASFRPGFHVANTRTGRTTFRVIIGRPMDTRFVNWLLCMHLLAASAMTAAAVAPASSYQQLANTFTDWRAFNHPAIVNGRPDYSAAAMAKKAEGLAAFRTRLKAIDTSG